LGDGRLNVTLGKFATCFGNWVPRHGFWDDPFLMPPLPYDNLLAVSNRSARNPSAATIATRATRKRAWVPIIWGPVYATGVALSGSSAHWDYAIEVKNASLVSQPDDWNPSEENGSHPTVTGRVGYRPDAAWAVGLSASHGTYLRRDAEPTLPAGQHRDDFAHSILGADIRWSHHQFQILGEVLASRSHTTAAGDLDALGYYVEGRWKVNSTLFVAARWAQEWSDDFAPAGPGRIRGYTREIWRATAAAGFRLTENVLVKTEYSYNGADAKENAFAVGIGLKF
jgi:opacity protein-like surface antigen